MNISVEYLYRDAGNNKLWGEVILTNKDNIDLELLEVKIRDVLIDGEFFIAEKVGLPSLHFNCHDKELDHDWHEYYAIKQSHDKINDRYSRDISSFIDSLRVAAKI